MPSRVPQSTALIASAITVKFILSAVYPEVLYIINLILTKAHRPILMLAVKKKVLLNVSSPEAERFGIITPM